METWMIYSLCASVVIGIYWFLQKVESESSVNRNSFVFYSHMWMVIFPLIYMFINWSKLVFDLQIILYALSISIIYVIILKFRLLSLNYLDSSSFFINYRIFSSILLIILGQLFFWENISINEYIGILLWFIIFYLLLEKKYNTESTNELYKGFIYLAVWVVWVSVIWIIQKNFVLLDLDFASYIFFAWLIGSIVTLLMKWKTDTLKDVLKVSNKKDIYFLLLCSIIHPLWIYCNMNAVYYGWDVAIVYKIVSYSLFIPIILSVIFYKEKITMKKLLAFILTIGSIGLFV